MGFLDVFRGNRNRREVPPTPPTKEPEKVVVGAEMNREPPSIQSYSNSNITYNGELSTYDYDSILRDKQNNIVKLFELSDYYTDADVIVRGIIKHVYVPYSSCSDWFLTDAKEKTIKLFEDQYKKMRLREKIDGIFYEYWKYQNVYIYLHQGQIITLPVHRCKIGGIALNGRPLVDFDCQSIYNN